MPIRSMTGFARVSRPTPFGELTLSIKAVNHRGLDLHMHLPGEFDPVEPLLRSLIRTRVTRGHIQVQASVKRNVETTQVASLNEPLFRAWLAAFRIAAEQSGIDSKPDLNAAFQITGMLDSRSPATPAPTHEEGAFEEEVLSAAREALDELDEFRLREGAATEAEIRARTASIREIVVKMEAIRGRALPAFHARIRERLGELLGSSHIDPARLVQEAAILAERSDISEELVRLTTHSNQLENLLAAAGETGKKLDLLLQEMNRETNTILSKTSGLGEQGLTLTELGLAAKAEIDRIREQSLNIE
jgi:uncharacterized protein (TIGR00255 family)